MFSVGGGHTDYRIPALCVDGNKNIFAAFECRFGPSDWAEPMLEVTDVDSGEFLEDLFNRMADELPEPAPRSSSTKNKENKHNLYFL